MNNREMIVWIVALALIAGVLFSPIACTMNRQMIVGDAIKAGSDPIAVKCAIESENSTTPLCIVKAMERK